jgi:hypothetical protein
VRIAVQHRRSTADAVQLGEDLLVARPQCDHLFGARDVLACQDG